MLTSAISTLKDAGIESAALDAQLLLAHVLGGTRIDALLNHALTAAQRAQFDTLIARRAAREPLSHILGVREFYGREFIVTKDVLDPRPDSETLIDAVLSRIPNRESLITILDLGTGSGCLLLTLLAELLHATGTGVDISPEALAVAARNAAGLNLSSRASFQLADLKAFNADSLWDVIISNPPYIPTQDIPDLAPEVDQFEPKLALDGGKDGLDYYRKLAKQLPRLLKPVGFVAFEIGSTQANHVSLLLQQEGFSSAVVKDLNGLDRVIIAQR